MRRWAGAVRCSGRSGAFSRRARHVIDFGQWRRITAAGAGDPMTHSLKSTAREERVAGSSGLNIFVRSWHPERATRAVVVICHGFNAHGGQYQDVGEQLAALDLAVYALDLRGRGRSDGERFYLEAMADYVSDVATVVALAKTRDPDSSVYLLGHSAGGVVSCIYTLEHQAE